MHNLVIDRNSLTHLTTNKEVICQTNSYIQTVFRQLESVLDSWSILWDKVNMFEQLLFKKVNEDNGSELFDCLKGKRTSTSKELRSVTTHLLTT